MLRERTRGNPDKVNQVIHNLMLAHGMGVKAIKFTSGFNKAGIAFNPQGIIPKTTNEKDLKAAKRAFDVHGWQNSWWFDPMFLGKYPRAWEEKGKDVPKIDPEDMEIISTPVDYFGFNYYNSHTVEADSDSKHGYKVVPYEGKKTAFFWPITPQTLYWGVKIPVEKYNIKEVYITKTDADL